VITGRPMRAPVCSSARPSRADRPLIVIGPVSGLTPSRWMRRIAAAARAERFPWPAFVLRAFGGFGGSTGFASISSIGVASTVLPP
jgi:hypothetical protein